ncbi:hypothetical protein BDY19DRAFT_399383 [Irpex rosettiformis]|uniref:Uncharacterized protein n=1 Tax=Irpex rosettiformis TaxID=378272 RepID=A0ACB8UFB7_9APHY|nr:hypothetical protein BDY19DRAFT_399383 [Irpex rosettiformis]
MCNLETEGIQYACGHYVITRKIRKIDCNKPTCVHSAQHRTPCNHCDYHEKFLGPDASEKIISVNPEFCDSCKPFWYDQRGGAAPAPTRRR